MIGTFIIDSFNIVGSLGLFLFGMKIMSDGIQKSSGEKFQNMLNFLTLNRFTGIITGFLITAVIHSSSATTVILVSLVNAGLMTLTRAISVIMGANIGTTVTAWLVSFLGFKFNINILIMPSIVISIPLLFSKYEKRRNLGELFIGFGIIFLGLSMLKDSVPGPDKIGPVLTDIISKITNLGFFSIILFIIIGSIVTMTIQSSGAAMTITITLLFKGIITFPMAAALCLGENIGTTITAFLASIGMSVTARRAARAHMLFNIIGVVWVTILFYPAMRFFNFLFEGLDNSNFILTLKLSAFHSIFNLTNTFLLIWFVPQIAKLVEYLVPDKKHEVKSVYKLNFLSTKFLDFAESNISLARNEIGKLSIIVYDMLLNFLNAIKEDKKELDNISDNIKNQDQIVNMMYNEISRFLASCRTDAITDKQSLEINSLLMIASEFKSISNTSDILIQLLIKKIKKKLKFHKNAKDEIKDYTVEVLDFLKYNSDFINNDMSDHNFNIAYKMEKEINSKRNRLRKHARNNMVKGGDIHGELLYMDIIKHLEHIGDFNLNIAHSLEEAK